MTIPLRYEMSVIGQASVKAAFAGVERMAAQHNARLTRAAGMTPSQAKSAGSKNIKGQIVREQKQMHSERMRQLKEVERAENSLNRQRSAALNQQFRAKQRHEAQMVRLSERTLAKQARAAERTMMESRRATKRRVSAGLDSAAGTVGTVGRAALGMATIGGTMLASSAISNRMSLDRKARRLIINARGPGQAGLMNAGALTNRMEDVGTANNIDPESIAGGLGAFVEKTGDLKTAVDNMDVFATVAASTGADFQDVASAAADLSKKMDITSVEDMKEAFATLTFQGKKGAFELKNMASEFPEILAAAKTAGVKGLSGVKDLGGFMQIARTSTGSAEETTTSIVQVFNQLAAKASKIQSGESFGGKKVNVYEGGDQTKGMRNFKDVIMDILSASGGNAGEIIKTLDIRGNKAVNPLLAAYKDANNAAGGGKKGDEAGRAAVAKMFDEASNAGGTWAEVQKDASESLKGDSAELEQSFRDLQVQVGRELTPTMASLLKSLVKLVPSVEAGAKMFAKLVDFLIENPFAGIGAIILSKITMDIMAAKIGEGIKSMISGSISASAGGKGGLLGSILNVGGAGLAIGAVTAEAIYTKGIFDFEKGEAEMTRTGKEAIEMRHKAADAFVSGDVSESDVEAAREKVKEQQKLHQRLVNESGMPGEMIMGAVGASNKETEIRTQGDFLASMEASLKLMEEALAKSGKQIGDTAAAAINAKTAGGKGPNTGDAPTPVKK